MSGFMPDGAGPRNKNNRAKSLFFSTELSTGTAINFAAEITAPHFFRGQIAGKIGAWFSPVENNDV